MYERRIECESEVGRMICDEIIDPAEMDATIARVIDRLTGSGAVGAIGNRRALRLGAEPIDTFRRYAALYAREQAWCHFSPALISNLELFWNAQNRKA
jgi:thioesterase DpgC